MLRRELNEVILRYRLEPELDDIYVEGQSDKRILDFCFRHLNLHRPVYEIDTINISSDTLAKYGFQHGNKSEVITLCHEVSSLGLKNVTFLVDKDLDEFFDLKIDLDGLRYTSHCDLPSVFFDSEIVHKIICGAGGANIEDWDKFFGCIETTVKSIFCLRLAFFEAGLHVSFPPIKKSLSKNGELFEFDIDHFLNRCRLKKDQFDNIIIIYNKWIEKVIDFSAKDAGRGHDYFDLIEWIIKKFGGNSHIAESRDRLLVLLTPWKCNSVVEQVV